VALALSSGVQAAWWATLGVGLVVAVVVWTLLEILRRTVHDVRRGVDDVLLIGGRLAQNTWTVQLLQTTKERGVELVEELGRAQQPEEEHEG
jgi:hypothetical protein